MLLLEGIVFVLLGIFALAHPFFMAMSLNYILGILLLIAGAVQFYRAIKDHCCSLFFSAIAALIIGILLLVYPLTGVMTLTLLLGIYFLVEGITKLLNSWRYRSTQGFRWVLLSGLISLLLAAMILGGFPTTSIWVIGVYFGIYMLFAGTSLIVIFFYANRNLPNQ